MNNNIVKKARLVLGLSRSEFAAALNASKRTVEKWEYGERHTSPFVQKQIRVMIWFYNQNRFDEFLKI